MHSSHIVKLEILATVRCRAGDSPMSVWTSRQPGVSVFSFEIIYMTEVFCDRLPMVQTVALLFSSLFHMLGNMIGLKNTKDMINEYLDMVF